MGIFKELFREIKDNANGLVADVGEDVREISTGQPMSAMDKDNRWRAIQEQRADASRKGPAGMVSMFNQSFLQGYQQSRRVGMQVQSGGRVLPAVPHVGQADAKDRGMCGPGY